MADTPKPYTRLLDVLPRHAYKAGNSSNELEAWSIRHATALTNPKLGFERALVLMVRGWLEYAESHEREYHSQVSRECVLGPAWESIGDALRNLLDGQTESLDVGIIGGVLLEAMKDAGFDTDSKASDE